MSTPKNVRLLKSPRNRTEKDDEHKSKAKKSNPYKEALEIERKERKELENCLKMYK